MKNISFPGRPNKFLDAISNKKSGLLPYENSLGHNNSYSFLEFLKRFYFLSGDLFVNNI